MCIHSIYLDVSVVLNDNQAINGDQYTLMWQDALKYSRRTGQSGMSTKQWKTYIVIVSERQQAFTMLSDSAASDIDCLVAATSMKDK